MWPQNMLDSAAKLVLFYLRVFIADALASATYFSEGYQSFKDSIKAFILCSK